MTPDVVTVGCVGCGYNIQVLHDEWETTLDEVWAEHWNHVGPPAEDDPALD